MLCDVNYFFIPFVGATVDFLVLCMFNVLVAAIGGLPPIADFVFRVVLLGTFGTYYDVYYSDFELNFIFSVSIPIFFIFFIS